MRHYKNIVKSQRLRFQILNFFTFVPDELMLKIQYRISMGKKLNLKKPNTLNEKLQWLKLYDNKPIYPTLVDKFAVREYIARLLGEDYLIPLIGVYDSVLDIPWEELPNQFVLKCTHGSHCNIICRNKSELDINMAIKDLTYWMRQNWYCLGRERPYKKVVPRIIAEEFIADKDGSIELTDYKFYCFDGNVDSVLLCMGREKGDPKFYFFDRHWELKRYNLMGKNAPSNFTVPKPTRMDEMFEIAKRLSKGFPFVRVDLYCSNGKIYFGELTLYPASGFDPNWLPEADLIFGKKVKLPTKSRG